MKKKFLGRVLTMLLVASMVFTLLPAPAIAAGNWWWNTDEYTEEAVPTATADNSNFMRIFHLDCGRKYFTKDEIFNIIDIAANCGYTHVELAFGNDGLRFLLSDMSLTANGKKYGSDEVKAAIQYGNTQYNTLTNYNQSTNELTEGEMREILAHASEVGIGIIPMFDAPGHMYALINGMKDTLKLTANYRHATTSGKNSQNWALILTDKSNEDSVAFVKALMQKYIQFFADNGAKYFNIAADECGFVSTKNGASASINATTGEYAAFAGFVNEMNSYVKSCSNNKMATMAFNDGFYHEGMQIADNAFDKDILICYWDASADKYAQAAALAQKGFRIINTNNRWYYVIGKEQSTGSGWDQYAYHLDYAINCMKNEDCLTIDGDGKQTVPVGCMTAVWCDNPNAGYDEDSVKSYMAAMQSNNPDYFKPTAAPDKPGTKLEKTIDVTVGGDYELKLDGNVEVVTDRSYNSSIATYTRTTKTEPTTTETPVTSPVGKSFYIKNMSGTTGTMYLGDGASWQSDVSNAKKWICRDYSYFGSTYYYLELDGASQKTYLRCLDGGQWSVTTSSSNRTLFNFDSTSTTFKTAVNWWETSYTLGTPVEVKTDSTPKTIVTFKGLAEGDTYVTIGNVYYTIRVTKEDLSKASTLPIQLWITNNSIQPTDDENFGKTGKFYTASGTWQSQWAYYYPISADLHSEKNTDSVNSENGMALSECIPSVIQNRYQYGTNYWATDKGNHTPYNFTLWRGEVFNTTTGFQKSGETSMLNKGVADFQYVRYLNNAWQVSLDRSDWKTVTGEGSTGTVSGCKEQLVAYYYMQTELTEEVTTNVLDWGDAVNSQKEYALLDFAVKYQSGTRVPDTFIQPEKTRVYNTSGQVVTDGNYRLVDEISVIKEQGFEVYMITLTPATGLGGQISKTTKYQYKETSEKVVWVDKVEDLPDDFKDSSRWYSALTDTGESRGLTFNAENGKNVGGDAIVPMVEIEKNGGTLVTYYIRPVKEETDTLQVNYVDLSDNRVFYDYSIAVNSGTTFDKEPTLTNGELKDYTIKGLKATETVYSDLTKMDGVPAAYRYAANITCKKVERSEDHKTLTLYYSFGRTTSFVVDFGLPVTIQPGDLNTTLGTNIERITKVTAVSSDGTASVVDKNVVFTPNKVYGVGSAKLAITYSGTNLVNNKENSVTYTIDILPASNVLYEENFLTEAPASSGLNWTKVASDKLSGSQETQKVGDTTTNYHVFGRDAAYDNAYGPLGVWKLGSEENPLQPNKAYSTLKTEFYGNGFDLIGNCGPTTGRVLLVVKPETGNGKIIDIDTRYSGETLYQVPLAHVNLGDADAKYSVTILASGLAATTVNTAKNARIATAAVYAEDSKDTLLMQVLAENGLTMADVEYVKVESAPAATTRSAASFYALDTADVGGTVTHEDGTHVEIDGFRVYRSKNNTNYPESEQNVRYLNILDAVSSFTAFVEGSATDNEWEARDKYENAGGPQNEIYLRKTDGENSAIAFRTGIGEVIQISARAVEKDKPATLVVNGETIVIKTNTEMYYTFTPDENGIVTIKNTGKGMLALGNLKIKKGTQVAALSEEDYPAAIALLSLNAAPETPDTAFDPAISAKVTTTRFIRSKVVTLTVSASSDVAVLKVNGVELRPTNSWLVKMGWSDTYTYILTEKVQKNESKTYEIVGYRADGAASAPIVVKSK